MDDMEVRIHEEINDYREKFKGFTVRQYISGIFMLAINVPLYLYTMDILGDELAQWLVVLVAIPFVFIGFIQIQNLDAEKIMPYIWRYYFSFSKPLPYKTEKEIQFEKEQRKKAHIETLKKLRIYKIYSFINKVKERFKHGIEKTKKAE